MKTVKLPANDQQIEAILKRHGVLSASVFGSFARGTDVKPDSDIDLLVDYKQGTTLLDVAQLQNELEQALGRKVDLISQRHLSKRLAERVQKDVRPLSSVL